MSERSEEFELTALESALRELHPRPETLDRAALMYRAGRASARSWIWPAATLFSTALALALGIALWLRPDPSVVYVAVPSARNDEVSASAPSPPRADESERGAWSRYIDLEEQVALYGMDGLPSLPNGVEEQPSSVESLLHLMQ